MDRRSFLGRGTATLGVLATVSLPSLSVSFEALPITYRGEGGWGAGAGRQLTASEVDNNFYSIHQRLSRLETLLRPLEMRDAE